MTCHDLRNALCVLHSIDGPLGFLSQDRYERFLKNPVDFFIRADDETAARLFEIIEKRMNWARAA